MGNCLRGEKVAAAATEKAEGEVVKRLTTSNLGEKRKSVRIKIVLTLEELEGIIKCEKHKGDDGVKGSSSAEQLVTALKLRGVRVYEVRSNDDDDRRCWRPALESIPEGH